MSLALYCLRVPIVRSFDARSKRIFVGFSLDVRWMFVGFCLGCRLVDSISCLWRPPTDSLGVGAPMFYVAAPYFFVGGLMLIHVVLKTYRWCLHSNNNIFKDVKILYCPDVAIIEIHITISLC